MTIIEWIGAGAGTLTAVGLAIFKSWQHNNNKVVQLDVRVEQNEKDINAMRVEAEKKFDLIHSELRDISRNNRNDIRVLSDRISTMNQNISFIKGYLLKKENESE